ncbi:hypothetical protein HN873_019012 [Arachis hypogaea]
MSSQLLRLNAFRGEPASSGFEWHFTPNHNSSADSSTSVGSDLHLVSPKLHPATAYESPAHSSTGTRLEPRAGLLPLLGSLRFHVLFHSPMGVLFTLPSRYYFTIGHPGVFSLARWSLLIHTGFHVPHATRVRATPPLRLAARRLYSSPTTPFSRFRLLPFRSPLLWESLLLSFPLATKMFQLARLSLACPWIQQQFERLTYSGISGSTLIFNSPKHFVAYYALPRLWVPSIALYRLSSRVGDKRTRTADIRHRLQENRERRAPFPPDSLVLRMLVLRMSDCPSPTLTAQPESG